MALCTLEDLADIFEEVVDLRGVRFERDAVLGEDLPIDSRDMLRVLARIEARYRIRFAPRETLAIRTVGDLLEAVNRRAAGR